MRLVCVIDVSHSMSEPYGPDDDVSKLEKVRELQQRRRQQQQQQQHMEQQNT